MQNEELKPCPFCGERAALAMNEENEFGAIIGGWFVICPKCHCSTDIYSKSGAIEAWNRRAERHGRWAVIHNSLGSWIRCTGCGCKRVRESPYCPNCGAKVVER